MNTSPRQTVFVVLLVASVIFLTNLKTLSSFDVWYHLSLGRHISETGTLPRANLLSYTAPGLPAPPLSWLFQWSIYQLYGLGGVPAIVLSRAACVAGIFVILFLTARARNSGLLPALVMLGLVALAARSRFVDRPHVPASLLMVVQVWLLESFRRTSAAAESDARQTTSHPVVVLAALGAVQALWANVHGSAVLGVVVAMVYGLGAVLDRLVSWESYRKQALAVFLLAPVVALAASGLNPMGWGLLTYPVEHARAFQALGIKDFFVERVSLRAADLLAEWPFLLIITLCAIGLVVSARKLHFIDLALLCSIGAAIHSARFLGEAALLVSPVAADLLTPLSRHPRLKLFSHRDLKPLAAGLLFLGMAGGAALTDPRPWGFALDRREYPVGAADCLEALGSPGPLFNDFEFGGYLAWRRHKVFMDSRGPGFYPDDLVRKYVSAIDRRFPDDAKNALDELDKEFQFQAAIVHHYMPLQLFRVRAGWEERYGDETATVFVKKRPDAASSDAGGEQRSARSED